MLSEVVPAVQSRVFITTGTGGGIGKEVALGDVVIAGRTKFDCTTQIRIVPWATASYRTSSIPAGAIESITPALTKVTLRASPVDAPSPRCGTRGMRL
jgi:uridine phosphorylase